MLDRVALILGRVGMGPVAPELVISALLPGSLIRYTFIWLHCPRGESFNALASLLPSAPAARVHTLPAPSTAPTASAPHRVPSCSVSNKSVQCLLTKIQAEAEAEAGIAESCMLGHDRLTR